MGLDFVLISFKRAMSVAHTSPNKPLPYNESFYIPPQAGSFSVFAQKPPLVPNKAMWSTDYIVERIRLVLDPIPGTESLRGTHGYRARLPDDYETKSNNPKRGEYPWGDGQVLADTNGQIQIISAAVGGKKYQVKLTDVDGNDIAPIGKTQWVLYESNGILYLENPPGCEENQSLIPGVPMYLECWIYIGKMVSDLVVYSSQSSSSSSHSSSSYSSSSSSFSYVAPVSANQFTWIQPSELIALGSGAYQTPNRFQAKTLIIFRRGLAVAQENDDGFLVTGENQFQLKEELVGEKDWIMVGYVSKDTIY